MGAFYGSVHVHSEDTTAVRAALEEQAGAGATRFLVAPPVNGWIAVFPSESGQDFAVSAAVAARLACPIVHLVLHDDDVFAYALYDAGGPIDEYSSNPEYCAEVPAAEWERTRGRPETLAALSGEDAAAFAAVLDRTPKGKLFRAQWQLERIASMLRLSNAGTSYEYLQAGERQGVQDWKAFVHVPDRSGEKAEARRKRTEQVAFEKALQRHGALLVRQAQKAGLHAGRPLFCAHPEGGFLFAWSHSLGLGDPEPLSWWRTPWSNPIDTGLTVARRSFELASSGTGRLLAVAGDHVRLVDLPERRVLATLSSPRPVVGSMEFSGLEDCLYVQSSGEILRISTTEPFAVRHVMKSVAAFTVHPDGRHLVAVRVEGHSVGLVISDLHDQRTVAALPTASHDFEAWREALAAGRGVTGFRPQDLPRKVGFSRDGLLLFVVVEEGLRAYRWREVRDAGEELPPPVASANSGLVEQPHGFGQQTYDFAHEEGGRCALFAGLDGLVHSLDLETGRSRVLLEVPGRPPVFRVSVSTDGLHLATTSAPGLFSTTRNPPAPVWHVWKRSALPLSATDR